MEPYIFSVTPLDGPRHRGQLSRALEKRSEVLSRDRCPRMWKLIDRLNRVKKVPQAVREKRRRRSGWLGLVNWILGMMLLMTGLMEPVHMELPLIVGAVGYGAGVVALWRYHRTLLALLSLLQGTFFLLVGSWDFASLNRLLLLGVSGAIVGVAALVTRRRGRASPFDRAADQLLCQRAEAQDMADIRFRFVEEGMDLFRDGTEEGQRFPYCDFELVVETEDLLVPFTGERVTVIQKKDLLTGTMPGLRAFLGKQTRYVTAAVPPEEGVGSGGSAR